MRVEILALMVRVSSVYEDRLEYDAETLATMYSLSGEDALTLRARLHALANVGEVEARRLLRIARAEERFEAADDAEQVAYAAFWNATNGEPTKRAAYDKRVARTRAQGAVAARSRASGAQGCHVLRLVLADADGVVLDSWTSNEDGAVFEALAEHAAEVTADRIEAALERVYLNEAAERAAASASVLHVRCSVCKDWLRDVPCAPAMADQWSDGLCAKPECKAFITGATR